MRYEVVVSQVVDEVVEVVADSENDAIDKAGQVIYEGDCYFDGMPDYRFSVREIVDKSKLDFTEETNDEMF